MVLWHAFRPAIKIRREAPSNNPSDQREAGLAFRTPRRGPRRTQFVGVVQRWDQRTREAPSNKPSGRREAELAVGPPRRGPRRTQFVGVVQRWDQRTRKAPSDKPPDQREAGLAVSPPLQRWVLNNGQRLPLCRRRFHLATTGTLVTRKHL
jgi:uncharacterized protein (DUF58 family)